MKYIHIFLKL